MHRNIRGDLGMAVPQTRTGLESPGNCGDCFDAAPEPVKKRVKPSKGRRARRKAYRPYYQLTEAERIMREKQEGMRLVRLTKRMKAKGRVVAPYNTTQFLMADHPDDTFDLLELLARPKKIKETVPTVPDEEEYYYTSPSDDEDYMSKEFNKDYEKQHASNLEMMSKEMLMTEYRLIQKKNETLEEKLHGILEEEKEAKPARAEEEGEMMLLSMQEEMEMLRQDNQKLVRSNSRIKEIISRSSGMSNNFSDDDNLYNSDDLDTSLNDTGYDSNHDK